MKKKIIISIIMALLLGVGILLGTFIHTCPKCETCKKCEAQVACDNTCDNPTIKDGDNTLLNHTFTRTYNINHIADSNDYDYIYITIRMFQDEEIETVKVRRDLFKDAKVGDNYEIEFKITKADIEDNIKSIFNSTDIMSVMKTDKTGLEQVYEDFK